MSSFIICHLCFRLLFVPIPILVGGEELYTQMGFFVQTDLVDRYIHRKEFSVVSLKSSSKVEFGIKKIFS